MRTTFNFTMLATWAALTALGHAQMSTFPTPPPLAPPADDATNSPSANASPDSDAIAAAEKKVLESAEAAEGSSASKPTAPSVSAETISSMTALDDKVALEAGDTISFRVIEDRDDAISRIVTDTGEVDFPLIGPVKVEGKTCHEVAVEVKKLLEVDYYKQATVIVGLDLIIGEDKTKPHDLAWVVGEVRDVGPLELLKAQPVTVSQAILRAGGFGEFADQRKVKLIHRSTDASTPSNPPPVLSALKDYQVIDVKSVFDGTSATDPEIRPGDYIIVPKKFINFN
jgi:polysaccharide export outer membrane protein